MLCAITSIKSQALRVVPIFLHETAEEETQCAHARCNRTPHAAPRDPRDTDCRRRSLIASLPGLPAHVFGELPTSRRGFCVLLLDLGLARNDPRGGIRGPRRARGHETDEH
ncbi:hypothetical protein PG995_011962 [Apiospora arundinis]